MLLYIHVPFCRSRCRYCAFHSQIVSQEAMDLYLDGLIKEIFFHVDRVGKRPIRSLFFGGGTPSLLPANYLSMIVATLEQSFGFEPGLEFTLEGNPNSLGDPGYLRDLKDIGVNRLSMGVQSLNDEMLGFLGRGHTARQAVIAYSNARNMGFGNINLDLIWGLPTQRSADYLRELKTVASMKPDHLSCYGLTVEPGTPLEKMVQDRVVELPEESELGRMFVYGSEFLASQGYLHYEVSNFARMGYQCRHNTGYWAGEEYLGLGPSAVSTMGTTRWENPSDLREWLEACETGTIVADPEMLGPGERLRERVMLSLRTSLGLKLKEYRDLSGRSFNQDHGPLAAALRQKDLIRIRDGYLRLTTQGMLVSDTIIENLFRSMDRIESREGRQAAAVKKTEP